MIRFPTTFAEAAARSGVVRAGATDLTDRRHLGLARGDLVDLSRLDGADRVGVDPGGLTIGARVTLTSLAADPAVRAGWPGLAAAAGGLATPAIRARATVGGALLQEVRCPYFRSRAFTCLKKGGDACLARAGEHWNHVVFDQGPCAAPHPSTLAVAALAWDAGVLVEGGPARTLAALYGGGRDPQRSHGLRSTEVLTHLVVPPSLPGERSAWLRTAHRALAEWPVVEVVVRVVAAPEVQLVRVTAGGVANTPHRLHAVEEVLLGRLPDDRALAEAAGAASRGANPLPGTGWKLATLEATVRAALQSALEAA